MSSTQNTRKPVSDLLGHKFGRLEVVEYLGCGKWKKHWWRCFCTCGGWTDLTTSNINSKSTLSCGCLRKETCLYSIYHGMLQRCYNPNSQRYKYYGSSGISVCADWKNDFTSFYKWAMSNGYQEGLSIDRLDSAEDYCPENCEWVTVSENSRRMNENRNR
jgi:hypothetical protein